MKCFNKRPLNKLDLKVFSNSYDFCPIVYAFKFNMLKLNIINYVGNILLYFVNFVISYYPLL